jgi:hypothetical protein
MTAPHARVGPAGSFCGQSAVRSFSQSVRRAAAPNFLDEPRDVVAALPAACRTLDAQHVELADQSADGSIAGHVDKAA